MSAPNSSRASPFIAGIRLALPATSPTGKSNWAMAMRRVSVMRVDPCVGSPASMDPRARPPPASQRLPRPTAGLPLPPLAGGGWEGGTLRSHRRTACPHPNPPPQAGEGAVPGGGGSRTRRRWGRTWRRGERDPEAGIKGRDAPVRRPAPPPASGGRLGGGGGGGGGTGRGGGGRGGGGGREREGKKGPPTPPAGRPPPPPAGGGGGGGGHPPDPSK